MEDNQKMVEVKLQSVSGIEKTELEILKLLKEQFPDKILLSIPEVAHVLRKSPGTIYNLISSGNCPVRFSRKGGKPLALLSDLAHAIAQQRG